MNETTAVIKPSHVMQHTTELARKQTLTGLQIRGLLCKGKFLAQGIEVYMPFIEAQAETEHFDFLATDKNRIRQMLNGNVHPADVRLLELTERTVQALIEKAA